MFSSDLLSKDADWFSRTGRLFISNVSIDTPPLTPEQAGHAGRSGQRRRLLPGHGAAGAPADANALTEGAAGAPPPSTTGTVALGHTECDVVRGIGAPDSVNLSNNARGDRVAVVTYSQGQRAGIYTFTAGRLTSIERAPEPVAAAQDRKAEEGREEETAGGDLIAALRRSMHCRPSSAGRLVILRTRRQPLLPRPAARRSPHPRAPC